MECNITEFVIDAGSLYERFKMIEDRRKKRGIRYSLPTVLLLIVLAKLCGEDKPYGIADWVQNRKAMLVDALHLKYPRLPHHTVRMDGFWKVARVKLIEQFQNFLENWQK